jgi:hypothetical protein
MTRIFRFRQRPTFQHHDTLVHEIVERLWPAMHCLLGSNTAAMSAAELRGYLRARAFGPVRTEVLQCVADQCATAAKRDELISAALDRIVHLAIQEHWAPPVVTIPMPHVRIRRAA